MSPSKGKRSFSIQTRNEGKKLPLRGTNEPEIIYKLSS